MKKINLVAEGQIKLVSIIFYLLKANERVNIETIV